MAFLPFVYSYAHFQWAFLKDKLVHGQGASGNLYKVINVNTSEKYLRNICYLKMQYSWQKQTQFTKAINQMKSNKARALTKLKMLWKKVYIVLIIDVDSLWPWPLFQWGHWDPEEKVVTQDNSENSKGQMWVLCWQIMKTWCPSISQGWRWWEG